MERKRRTRREKWERRKVKGRRRCCDQWTISRHSGKCERKGFSERNGVTDRKGVILIEGALTPLQEN